MTKRSIKERVVELLKREQAMTVPQLLSHFSISDIALRRHLKTLEREGTVEAKTVKQEIGRPFLQYRLTEKAQKNFPQHYEQLSISMLNKLENQFGKDFVEALISDWTADRMESYQQQLLPYQKLSDKMEQLLTIQKQEGYMSSLKQIDSQRFQLDQYHCPIYSIACNYKAACLTEESFFRELLPNATVKMNNCIAMGEQCCSFLIEEK
ncbi:helix-turn-helix transcriptional regulator [Gracilibacillus suaedae]|uniref:helix-turn-helix transcriptional regulator n=1 Tax=Gracilibacillus suaedae TaxID=2820273 RepID=UPI001ABE84F2